MRENFIVLASLLVRSGPGWAGPAPRAGLEGSAPDAGRSDGQVLIARNHGLADLRRAVHGAALAGVAAGDPGVVGTGTSVTEGEGGGGPQSRQPGCWPPP